MSRIAQHQDTEHDPPSVSRQSNDGMTPDITFIRPERPVPADPREQQTIRNDLIVFAVAGLVALALSFLSR